MDYDESPLCMYACIVFRLQSEFLCFRIGLYRFHFPRETRPRSSDEPAFTWTRSLLPRQTAAHARTMPYRLPLELELTILELAAPPLAIDRLPDRVDFFIKVSLIHRSLTAWAQDKLRDQFLYTYQPRPDEHERLKTRLEAGFGRDRPLRRLYLDLIRLPGDISGRTESGTDSVSATINGQVYRAVSTISGPSESKHFGTESSNQACESVANFAHPENTSPLAGYWRLCAMITNYSQALDTLWIWPPFYILDIKDLPRESCFCGRRSIP